MVSVSAYAADGYVKLVTIGQLQKEKPKMGDVYKVRQFNVAREYFTHPYLVRKDGTVREDFRGSVDIQSIAKDDTETVRIDVTRPQLATIEKTVADPKGTILLRKTANGWEFAGTEVYRDASGKVSYR